MFIDECLNWLMKLPHDTVDIGWTALLETGWEI